MVLNSQMTKLDNPVWFALSEEHRQYRQLITDFYVVGERPGLPGDVSLKGELICLQMVLKKLIPLIS